MAAPTTDFKVFGLKLWQQVLIGLFLGIIVGIQFKLEAAPLKIFGDIFIDLIKMIVAPLILFALVSGVTSMSDSHNFTRVGLKGLFFYLGTAVFAVIIGLVAGYLFQPGKGVALDLSQLSSNFPIAPKTPPSLGAFLYEMVPNNIVQAMASGHYIQVVVFAIFTGVTINMMGSRANKAKEIINEFAQITFKMIEIIIRLAPLAVFGFMSWTVGTQGLEIVNTLTKLLVAVIAACSFQYVLFGVFIIAFARLNPLPFYKKMLNTQIMAFSTTSSKATLTTAMRELQTKLGVSEKSTNFLLPLGASINMDGTAIYLAICALFFAQLYGIEINIHDIPMLIIACTLGSIGAAGIPGGSIIFMGMVLNVVGLPVEGIGLILGVDRLLDMVRTTINITGDAAVTLIIDKTEGQLNTNLYNSKIKKEDI